MSEKEAKKTTTEEKKKKKKNNNKASNVKVLSWPQKKELADKEEEAIREEVKEVISWTSMVEAMDDNQLKEYLPNRPASLENVTKLKDLPTKKVRRNVRLRAPSSSSAGLMAAVWKFHREDDEEASMPLQS
ncbi:uncharacterized protein [Typha angustifolia]|uniref:uncharacterized protein n=1 Tax=Typha angustifolia TaxID=59011 RepID=UPI003C300D2E